MRLRDFMMRLLTSVLWVGVLSAAAMAGGDPPVKVGSQAFYLVSTSVEHQVPCVSALRLAVTGRENVDGKEMFWWELTAGTRNAKRYGVRILSERVAMTSPDGLGRIERYMYRDANARVIEYRDGSTGRALLPGLQFEESFLPRPACDAVYEDGFASAGAFIGHVCVRTPFFDEPARVSFDDPIVLDLRCDLLIGAQTMELVEPPTKGADPKRRLYAREDFDTMVRAGLNYFPAGNVERLGWMLDRAVFFRTTPAFPDTFYRSNWVPGGGFLDEPMVRLGWSGGIPHNPLGPEQVAEALRQRVASFYTLERYRITPAHQVDLGTLDLYARNRVSWDTDYWSAWYQLAAGAPGIVHEGRYVTRGYGWHPEELFGNEGLDSLTFRDQVNCLNAFLRGAARAFDGDWGVSVYPEGDPELRLPAMKQAYDMGAKYVWFWAHYPEMPFHVQEAIARGLKDHIAKHPRGDIRKLNRSARVGIAFPSGYVFSWHGTWGSEPEQHSREGASYADISAAGLWEGIICSRRGIPFDFLVDEPRIRDLGYERLAIVRPDGSVDVEPPRRQARAATSLSLEFEDDPVPNVTDRAAGQPDCLAKRAGKIIIDGRLADWNNADWISLDSGAHGFPDVVDAEATVVNDISNEKWRKDFETFKGMLGMKLEQITPEFEKKYVLEDFRGKGVVVTGVEAGSPAAKAGIREGDVITGSGNGKIDWHFQMFQRLRRYMGQRDGERIPFKLRRSGRYHFGAPGDLAAEVALAVDDDHLYVAARVTDDVHSQRCWGWEYWKGDCVQFGFDPTLERRSGGKYGEEDHEIGLILKEGRAFAWRWHGRRGQPLGLMTSVRVRIVPEQGRTIYEAAIPLAELMPMVPDLWPAVGFDIVVNDNDGGGQREGRLELRLPAMTLGKNTRDFATLRFDPSPRKDLVSAALLWRRRATEEGGSFRLVVAARSPAGRDSGAKLERLQSLDAPEADVVAVLQSLDSPHTPPVMSRINLPLSPQAREHSLTVRTQSPPGRYRLTVRVETADGTVCAEDSLPVYIYPRE